MGNLMGRAAIGAVAAAVAMFILGFIFYATPLQKIAVASATDAQAAATPSLLDERHRPNFLLVSAARAE